MNARSILIVLLASLLAWALAGAAHAQEAELEPAEPAGITGEETLGEEIAEEVKELAAETRFISVENAAYVDGPDPIGVGLRRAVTPVAEEVHHFYEYILLPMKLLISFLVLGLIIWVLIRYNKLANPVARKFSHNTAVEVAWTAVPVIILLIIALPSFDLLYLEDTMPDGQRVIYEGGGSEFAYENDFEESRLIEKVRHLELTAIGQDGQRRMLGADDYEVEGFGEEELIIRLASPLPVTERLEVVGGRSRVGRKPILGLFGEDYSRIVPAPSMTVKATGYQWGWAYSYPDFGDFEFDALMAPPNTVPAELYRLAATNAVVVPAGETVRVITTGRDVIHSWAMPAFGVKIDAIPGRLNETWFYTEEVGNYYGQCSEICGKDHAFMPIQVTVVTRPEFEAWVDDQRELGGLEPLFAPAAQVAALPAAALPETRGTAPADADLN
jgi:cytochrome c oxidase subunit 2